MSEKNNTIFVICEYNPFHFGHEYQISRFREKQYNTVICIMSGDAVQRGEAAVYSKYARAEAAVRCGADAVFELPFPFACMAAPDFSLCGVYAASALGCENLAFGAEGDEKVLTSAAEAAPSRDEIREYMKAHGNISYPKAVCSIISGKVDIPEGFDLSAPNNILGMEYIRAAKKLGADIHFEIIRRMSGYKSSSQIRERADMTAEIPPATAEVLSKHQRRSMSNLDSALMATCRMLDGESDVYGLDRGDVLRLKNASLMCGSAADTVKKAASATMTEAKARRGMLCALLGITREDAGKKPLFLRLLALNEKGAEYISKNKKSFALPVVSKPSHIEALGEEAVKQSLRALKAESVLALSEGKNSRFDGVNRKSIMIR